MLQGGGIADQYALQSLADMKFWCVTEERRSKKASQKYQAEMQAACDPSQLSQFMPAGLEALISGGRGGSSSSSAENAGQALTLVQQLFEGGGLHSQAPLKAGSSGSCLPRSRICRVLEKLTIIFHLPPVQERPIRRRRPKRRPRARRKPRPRRWESSLRVPKPRQIE